MRLEANLAVLIDFENIAAGTEKEGLGRFDVETLLKRLKDKGRILVSRSYADWGRFARFKQNLLSANVTMMELTSHGMHDKNRADIAMVVDCLELAFTKDYIDTFVVVSGDSDFTPLVLKMRELNKRVIGCGTRASTSRLLIQACDEFLFYDSVVKRTRRRAVAAERPDEERAAFALLVDALEGLQRENPDPVLASVVKTAMRRKSPDFNEADLGFPTFARFLEAAKEAGYVVAIRDRKSGGYRVDSTDTGPDEAPRRLPAPKKNGAWRDPYLPEGVEPWVEPLVAKDIDPLAHSTRMALLQLLEHVVEERRNKRRRVNIQFVQEDVRKRMRKTHPDMPSRAVKGVFTALLQGGCLMHKDGSPIRSGVAPFVLDKDAETLNRCLAERYLRVLREQDAELDDPALLGELFFGNPERKKEVEEILAWMQTEGDDAEEPEVAPTESADIDIDAVLLAEEEATEEAQAKTSTAEPDPVTEPSEAALEAGEDTKAPQKPEAQLEEAAKEDEPEQAVKDDEAPAKQAPTKRTTRTRAKATAADGEQVEAKAPPQGDEEPAKPKRRRTRRSKTAEKADEPEAQPTTESGS